MQAWHALSGLIAQMKTAPSFFLRAAVAKKIPSAAGLSPVADGIASISTI